MTKNRKTLYKRIVKGPSGLKPLARSFVKKIKPGTVIMLEGVLGAGKTTFVRALCKELSVDPSQVRSPSYTLINEYEGTQELPWTVYHMDLYRLNDSSEIHGLGLSEYIEFSRERTVSFIEWPEFAQSYLEETAAFLFMVSIKEADKQNERLVIIDSIGK